MLGNTVINRINLIFENLRCKEIVDFLNQWNIDKVKLLSLVIESKLGFDRLILDEECKKFIEDIEESSIYSVSEYSQLIMFISTMGELNSRFNTDSAVLNRFQTFHKMLYKTGSLVLKLLHENNEMMNYLNPQTQPGIMENPLRNNISAPPASVAVPAAQVAPSTPSKVVTFDFSKMNSQQHVQASHPQVSEKDIVQPKPDSFEHQSSYQTQHEKYTPKPREEGETVEDNDMSLTNFLQSLAMLNVPAE